MSGLADIWVNSPLAQQYFANNPSSLFARLYNRNNQPPNSMGNNAVGGYGAPGGMAFGTKPVNNMGNNAVAPMYGSANNSMVMPRGVTSFAAGGMVAPGGGAIRPGAPMQSAVPEDEPMMGADAPAPMSGGQIDQEAKQMAQRNPQAMAHVQQLVAAAIQQGMITPDKLNMMVQLAKAAIANPSSYPQIRQFAIKNGLGTEADIPQRYDPGILYVLITVGHAMQNGGAGVNASAPGQGVGAPAQPKAGLLPEYSDGGMTGDRKHLALVHPREYVIPEDTLLYHGKKHFDKLIEQARAPKDGSTSQ